MNIDHTGREQLLNTLQESRSFKRNRIPWTVFYVSATATTVMFIILICLSVWTVHIGQKITDIVSETTSILNDVEEMLPILDSICKHDNFTKTYGNICHP